MRFFSTLLASLLGTLIGLGLLFVFGTLFIIALASTSEQAPGVRPGTIVVADLSGSFPELVSGDPLAQAFGGEASLSLHDALRGFRMAAADDRIDGVWLRLGNVSTSWASLEALRRGIEEVRVAGKPVYASSNSFYMAEDELYLASAADSVVLDPESLFEFNGFALQLTFFKRLFDRAGVEPQVVRAGRFKSAVEPYTREDMSDENRVQLMELVKGISAHFVATLAGARSLDVEQVNQLLQAGSVMTARDAQQAGLIDGLGYSDEVRAAFGEDPRTISLARYARSSPSAAGVPSGSEGEIAVVFADGDIVAGDPTGYPGQSSGSIGSEKFVKAMRDARESSRVDAIVVRVNSPGGFAPAADAMLREIQLAIEEKPVLVSMGGLAASGGYWIAAPADTIVAESLTLTGSIGVFGLLMDLSGLLEDRVGITFDEVTSAPSADMASGVRGLTASERAVLEASIDQTYERFLDIVADGRGMTRDEVDAIAQGRVWTGEDAVEVGLVDLIGGLDRTISLAAERAGLAQGTYRVRFMPKPPSVIEMLTQSMEARVHALASRLAGPALPEPVARLSRELSALYRLTTGVQARLPITVDVH